MRRTLAFCLLLPLVGAAFAATPATPRATTADDASLQQQMATLQSRMNELARQMAALSTRLGDHAHASALRYLSDSRQGMLGIAVTPVSNGLRVEAVTPGGPGERADIKVGDVIASVNGKATRLDSPLGGLDGLEAGTPARIELKRGGKTLRVEATPARMQDPDIESMLRQADLAAREAGAAIDTPEFRQRIQQRIDQALQGVATARAKAATARSSTHWQLTDVPWWGLNLAPLNPALGKYFGTGTGALVLSRDAKRFPKLEPGDVITQVGDIRVRAPEDVLRALRNGSDDSHPRVTLRRHGKTLTLALAAPPRWMVVPPMPPLPPPPPPAPAAPSLPAPPPPPPAPPAPPPPTSP